MPSEFTVEVKCDVTIPDFMDADIPLRQIADKLVVESQRNIRRQQTPDGDAFTPLSKRTIRQKIKLRSEYPKLALYRKGVMFRAIHAYKLGKNEYVVGVIPRGVPRRDLVALIHSEIGVGKNRIIRPFIGMSSKLLTYANDLFTRWISAKAQKAARKLINLKY